MPYDRNAYNRRHYAKLRALGLPAWRASHRKPDERIQRIRDGVIRNRKNPNWKSVQARYRGKMYEMYGARPDSNAEARMRWLIAKSKFVPGVVSTASSGTRSPAKKPDAKRGAAIRSSR